MTPSPNQRVGISKFVYPSLSMNILPAENNINNLTSNGLSDAKLGNISESTSTISSTQQLLNTDLNIQGTPGSSSTMTLTTNERSNTTNSIISYTITTKNNSVIFSSPQSKTPLID